MPPYRSNRLRSPVCCWRCCNYHGLAKRAAPLRMCSAQHTGRRRRSHAFLSPFFLWIILIRTQVFHADTVLWLLAISPMATCDRILVLFTIFVPAPRCGSVDGNWRLLVQFSTAGRKLSHQPYLSGVNRRSRSQFGSVRTEEA